MTRTSVDIHPQSTTQKVIRIFISSPGDVTDERENARRVIGELQREYADVTLLPILWEDIALPATATFQNGIDLILQSKPIDIAIFLLWSRIGSPLGAPCKADGTPYRSGTEREFDLMLTAFEQSGKKRPQILWYIRDRQIDWMSGAKDDQECQERWSQRELSNRFIAETFYDADGRNSRAFTLYRDAPSFASRLRVHLRDALDVILGLDAAPRWTEEPYRGLQFFDISHALIFRGRDEETCDVLQRLRDQGEVGCGFVVIVGASGSGKSSLARAGVAHALIQHPEDHGVKEWRTVSFTPSLNGSELCINLIRALAEQLPELCNSEAGIDKIANAMLKDPSLTVELSIIPAFHRASESAQGQIRTLIILDQMEELWTDRRITAESREQFLLAIEALAGCGHIAVLATLRSDFYVNAQLSATFLRLKGERGHFDLLPPSTGALHRLITEPARIAGLRFERDERTNRTLDEIILEDASRDPSALPLLQYALSELYRQRDMNRKILTFASYERLGGVEGAIAKRASDTYGTLGKEARSALPKILSLLVTVDPIGTQAAVRRRAPLSKLTSTPARKALTECLIAARFITTDRNGDKSVASLAHEALLRRWKEIAVWVSANRQRLHSRARLEQYQQRWLQHDHDPSLLLPAGLPLEEGRQLLMDGAQLITPKSVEFIQRSISHYETELQRQRRLRQFGLSASLIATVVAIIAAVWINTERRASDFERQQAIEAWAAAESAQKEEAKLKVQAEAQTELARKQSQLADDQRLSALHAKALAEAAEKRAAEQRQQAVGEAKKALAQLKSVQEAQKKAAAAEKTAQEIFVESGEERKKKDVDIDGMRRDLKLIQDDYANLDEEYKKFVDRAEKREKVLSTSVKRLLDEIKEVSTLTLETELFLEKARLAREKCDYVEAHDIYQEAISLWESSSQPKLFRQTGDSILSLKEMRAFCDDSQRAILDPYFALSQDKAVLLRHNPFEKPLLQLTRVQALHRYATCKAEEIPKAIRDHWAKGEFSVHLLREAESTSEKLRGMEPATPSTLFSSACCFGLCLKILAKVEVADKSQRTSNLRNKALDALTAAIDSGYGDSRALSTNPDLELLRELTAFKALASKVGTKDTQK